MSFANGGAVGPTQVTAIGGRHGSAASADGAFRVALGPAESPCNAAPCTSPEHLYAAASAVSFLSAIKDVAADEGLVVTRDSNVTSSVRLAQGPARGCVLDVTLTVDLPGVPLDRVQQLVDAARLRCPYAAGLREVTDLSIELVR